MKEQNGLKVLLGILKKINLFGAINTNNQLEIVCDDFDKPNGLAFSPDEDFLYIADSGASFDGIIHPNRPHHIRKFKVIKNNYLEDLGVFTVINPGVPDGFSVDFLGNIYTIRFLCADSVEKAKSGHPGAPMGLSPLMYVLWKNHLKFNPENPEWFNRDRFILSAGHASILLYSMLHLSGYDLSLDDLKSFRQLHSKTPGHPEFGVTKGVEATTGPLGQGFANGIGIAIAEKILSTRFNHPNIKLIDHYTYSVVSDGDLMEGITSLEKDEEIDKSIERAKKEASKPSLIIINSQIGYGSPNKAGKESAHGEPLGKEEVELTRKNLQWKYKPFEIPKELNDFKNLCTRNGKNEESKWKKILKKFQLSFPIESNEFNNIINNNFPENWDSLLREEFNKDVKEIATRSASSTAINAISEKTPNFVGGSADLAGSNKTTMNNRNIFQPNTPDGTNIYFGIREHAFD